MSSWLIWYVTWCASLTIHFHHHPKSSTKHTWCYMTVNVSNQTVDIICQSAWGILPGCLPRVCTRSLVMDEVWIITGILMNCYPCCINFDTSHCSTQMHPYNVCSFRTKFCISLSFFLFKKKINCCSLTFFLLKNMSF